MNPTLKSSPNSAARSRLFDSIPVDRFHLIGPNNLADAKKVVDFLGFKKSDVSEVIGIPLQSVRYDERIPTQLQERALEWAIAINQVGSFFKDEPRTILWFSTPNRLLGGVSPKKMIRRGRFKKLIGFIMTALSENQPRRAA